MTIDSSCRAVASTGGGTMALDTFITFPAVDVAGPPTAVERSGRIDVFSVGGSKLLHWWWDQLCWRGPQDCGGNLPAEGVAAVVGGREEIYVYAVDANGQLLGWMFQDNAARPPLITGPVVISSPGLRSHPPAAALYDGRIHVFAVSRGGVFEGGQLLHWASELATASEPANGLRFAATFSDPSGPFRNPEHAPIRAEMNAQPLVALSAEPYLWVFGVERGSGALLRWRFKHTQVHLDAVPPQINGLGELIQPVVAVSATGQIHVFGFEGSFGGGLLHFTAPATEVSGAQVFTLRERLFTPTTLSAGTLAAVARRDGTIDVFGIRGPDGPGPGDPDALVLVTLPPSAAASAPVALGGSFRAQGISPLGTRAVAGHGDSWRTQRTHVFATDSSARLSTWPTQWSDPELLPGVPLKGRCSAAAQSGNRLHVFGVTAGAPADRGQLCRTSITMGAGWWSSVARVPLPAGSSMNDPEILAAVPPTVVPLERGRVAVLGVAPAPAPILRAFAWIVAADGHVEQAGFLPTSDSSFSLQAGKLAGISLDDVTIEAFGVTRDSRIARWRFDGSAWHEVAALVPNDWADTLRPSVAVVARNQRLEVFAVGNQSRASSQVTTGIEHWTPDAAGAAAAFHSPTDGLSPTGDDILAVARGQDIHVVVPGSRFAVTFPQSGPVVETALPYLEYACAVAARAHVESHPGPLGQRRDQVVLDYLTTRGDHGTWDGSRSMPPSILLHLPGATGTMTPALVSLSSDCLDAFGIDANGRLIHWFII